ncbi:MAG: putative glycosyltransferase EpsD, partial [Pseudomonadota bacterium]
GPTGPAIREHVDALGLARKVSLLGEVADGERVLSALDVYMLSSIDEGMNLTLLEAMATALPVVATAVGGNPEVVRHEASGLLVPARDPAAMAAAMLRLAGDAALRARLGAAGQARVREDFSQARAIQDYLRLYRGARAADVGWPTTRPAAAAPAPSPTPQTRTV